MTFSLYSLSLSLFSFLLSSFHLYLCSMFQFLINSFPSFFISLSLSTAPPSLSLSLSLPLSLSPPLSLSTGGPAESSGLRPGDLIVSINNQDVSGHNHFDLISLIKHSSANGKVVMGVVRRPPSAGKKNIMIY